METSRLACSLLVPILVPVQEIKVSYDIIEAFYHEQPNKKFSHEDPNFQQHTCTIDH